MKKLHLVFGILASIMTFAATTVALILFVGIVNDPYTGFPAWAIFAIVGIYYAIGLAVLGFTWLITWLGLLNKACKNEKKCYN